MKFNKLCAYLGKMRAILAYGGQWNVWAHESYTDWWNGIGNVQCAHHGFVQGMFIGLLR